MKQRISTARGRLRVQSERLEESINRLQERNKELFEKCVSSKAANNHSRALIYANECAEIRKIAKVIINGQLALEQVILRLETVEELGDIFVQLGPLINIVQEIQGQLTGVLPEVSYELGEINSALNTAVLEAGTTTDNQPMTIPLSDEEAERVLAEAKVIADERMRERFPFLSEEIESAGVEDTSAEKVSVEETTEKIDDDLVEKVYEYILSKGDKTLSISACASALKFSPEQVRKALDLLTEKNRILVQEKDFLKEKA